MKLILLPLIMFIHVSLFALTPQLTNNLSFQEIQKIASSDIAPVEETNFAYKVAMDGDIALIASQGDGSTSLGGVYIYKYDASSMEYDYQAKLTPSDTNVSKRYFATAIAISGDTIVVGAPKKDATNSMVYVYKKQGVDWVNMTETAELYYNGSSSSFGRSVAIEDKFIFVGDSLGGNNMEGVVHFYKILDGEVWTDDNDPTRTISPNNGIRDDFFGSSIAFENNILAVGSPRNDNNALTNNGAVYVYKYQNFDFTELAKLTKTQGSPMMGGDIALKGTTIIAGATFRSGGEVYLFEQENGEWDDSSVPTAVLTGSDIVRSHYSPYFAPVFGVSLSIYEDTIFVGSYNKAVYLYEKPYGGWEDMNQTTQILDANDSGSTTFASQIAYNGDAMFIKTTNAVYVFKEGLALSSTENIKEVIDFQTSDEASQTYTLLETPDKTLFTLNSSNGVLSFKTSPDFELPQDAEAQNHYKLLLDVDNGSESTKYPISIHLEDIEYEAGDIKADSFNTLQQLNATVNTGQTLRFGTSMAINGNTIVIGDTGYNDGQNQVGAAFVFELNTTSNLFEQKAILSTWSAQESEYLGSSVAIQDDVIVVSAADERNGEAGHVYVYLKPQEGWSDTTPTTSLLRHRSHDGEEFAKGIAISQDKTIVVSAPNNLISALDYVYLYEEPQLGWGASGDRYETALLYTSVSARNPFGGADFGESIAINNNTVAVGAPYAFSNRGGIFIYERPISGWVSMTQSAIQAAFNHNDYRALGWSVDMEGNTIAAGAPQVFGNEVEAALFTFEKPSNGWGNSVLNGTVYKQSVTQDWDKFAQKISFSNDTLVSSANGDLYIFDKTQTTQVDTILHSDSHTFEGFDIQGDLLIGGFNNSTTIYKADMKKAGISPALIMYLLN